MCVVADVSNEDHVQSMVKKTVDALGELSVKLTPVPFLFTRRLTAYVGDDCECGNYRTQAPPGAQPARMGEGTICMLCLSWLHDLVFTDGKISQRANDLALFRSMRRELFSAIEKQVLPLTSTSIDC